MFYFHFPGTGHAGKNPVLCISNKKGFFYEENKF